MVKKNFGNLMDKAQDKNLPTAQTFTPAESTSHKVNKSENSNVGKSTDQYVDKYKRATYHLTPKIIKGVKTIAFYEERNLSDVVREALTEYLIKKKIM